MVILRGEAGAGKSALLKYLIEKASGYRLLNARGVESEMELAYSGLHQLCLPLLGDLDRLPIPQRDALTTVFGLSPGAPPDGLLVGLAMLTLMADSAEDKPLACVVDDAHWLDKASAQILGFVARRLLAERIVMAFAARTDGGDDELAGLPEMAVRGLQRHDARTLLLDNLKGPLDAAVCEQIVSESRGNPLVLLEFPRTWGSAELHGGFGVPDSRPVATRLEESFTQRIAALPTDTQRLLVLAAAEPLGSTALLVRAAAILGLDLNVADSAISAGLVTIDDRVEFAHPLVRSATYRSATSSDRRRAHNALAEVTDPATDPDRRAWHKARGAVGPDENVAADLERSAERAQARGGFAAAAAFLHRAAALSVDPSRRAARALDAALASVQAGALDQASSLLDMADAGPLDDFQRARIALERARVAYLGNILSRDGAPLLLDAGRRLEPFDTALARETYLNALLAAVTAGCDHELHLEICRAAQALPVSDPPTPLELFVEALTRLMTDGHTAALPAIGAAAVLLHDDISVDELLSWRRHAVVLNAALWDPDGYDAENSRRARLARDAGALAVLRHLLVSRSLVLAWMGDLAGTAALVAEVDSLAWSAGGYVSRIPAARLHGLSGDEEELQRVVKATADYPRGSTVVYVHYGVAVLNNGLGNFEQAMLAAIEARAAIYPLPGMWVLPELVEAAVRSRRRDIARTALADLMESTQPAGNDVALGLEAALVAPS